MVVVDGTRLRIEIERETDGRFIAEAPELPGVMAYGATAGETRSRVLALALRALAERLESDEEVPQLDGLFVAA